VLIEPRRVVDPDEVLTPAEAKKVRHALKQIPRWENKALDQDQA
jgi:hypothetical protein